MPVILPKRSRLIEAEEGELALFNEDGEPTLAGEVVADFLEHADFSAVFEHPEAQKYIIHLVEGDGDDETVVEEVLPGEVAVQLVDEADLVEMFLHYLDVLGEHALAEDAPMEEKARLAVFERHLLDERYRRGAFRKIRAAEGGAQGRNSQTNMMLGAMLAKGEIKRTKPGKGYKGGDYTKGSRYRSGATKSAKAKGKRIARRMRAKNMRAKKSSARRRAGRRGRQLAASIGMEEGFVFGEGVPYRGALFAVDTDPRAIIEFTDEELADLCERYDVFSIDEMKKGCDGAKRTSTDGEDDEEGYDETVSEASMFATGIGTAPLNEGPSLARRMMQSMGTLQVPANQVNG